VERAAREEQERHERKAEEDHKRLAAHLARLKRNSVTTLYEKHPCKENPRIRTREQFVARQRARHLCERCGARIRHVNEGATKCQRCNKKIPGALEPSAPAPISKFSLRNRVHQVLKNWNGGSTLKHLFDYIDTDMSGVIDGEELQAALHKMGCIVTGMDKVYLLELMDEDGDGTISLPELKSFMDGKYIDIPVEEQGWYCANEADKTTNEVGSIMGPYLFEEMVDLIKTKVVSKKSVFWTQHIKAMPWKKFKSREWTVTKSLPDQVEIAAAPTPARNFGLGARAKKKFSPVTRLPAISRRQGGGAPLRKSKRGRGRRRRGSALYAQIGS
jgi:ribosomal protein L37AE/L43A